MNSCSSCGEMSEQELCADCKREAAERTEDAYHYTQYTQQRLDVAWGEWAEGTQRELFPQ